MAEAAGLSAKGFGCHRSLSIYSATTHLPASDRVNAVDDANLHALKQVKTHAYSVQVIR